MTSEKLKPTPGPWRYRLGDEWSQCVVTDDGEFPDGRPKSWTVASMNSRRDEREDNARLIAEAGTVHHECGLSPRELLHGYQEMHKLVLEAICALETIPATVSCGLDPSESAEHSTQTIEQKLREITTVQSAALAKHKEV